MNVAASPPARLGRGRVREGLISCTTCRGASDHDGLYIPGKQCFPSAAKSAIAATGKESKWADVPWANHPRHCWDRPRDVSARPAAARCSPHRDVGRDCRVHGYRPCSARQPVWTVVSGAGAPSPPEQLLWGRCLVLGGVIALFVFAGQKPNSSTSSPIFPGPCTMPPTAKVRWATSSTSCTSRATSRTTKPTSPRAAKNLSDSGFEAAQTALSAAFAFVTITLLTFLVPQPIRGDRPGDAQRRPVSKTGLRLKRIAADAASAVSGYVIGNLIISLIAGVAAFICLVAPWRAEPRRLGAVGGRRRSHPPRRCNAGRGRLRDRRLPAQSDRRHRLDHLLRWSTSRSKTACCIRGSWPGKVNVNPLGILLSVFVGRGGVRHPRRVCLPCRFREHCK